MSEPAVEITLVVKSPTPPSDIAQVLNNLPGVDEAHEVDASLGVRETVHAVVQWILKLVGSSAEIADGLIEQSTKQLAGAEVMIQTPTGTIHVTNVNRAQLIDTIEAVRKLASEQL